MVTIYQSTIGSVDENNNCLNQEDNCQMSAARFNRAHRSGIDSCMHHEACLNLVNVSHIGKQDEDGRHMLSEEVKGLSIEESQIGSMKTIKTKKPNKSHKTLWFIKSPSMNMRDQAAEIKRQSGKSITSHKFSWLIIFYVFHFFIQELLHPS